MRSQEEAFMTFDYMDLIQNQPLAKKQKNVDMKKAFTKKWRSYGIQKIFYFHQKKKYKIETLFIAAGIFDRYLMKTNHQNFPVDSVCLLSATSLFLAAKLEEPLCPSYSLFPDRDKIAYDRAGELELAILTEFGCDFNF